jgi:hypothetical protein
VARKGGTGLGLAIAAEETNSGENVGFVLDQPSL